VNWATFPRLEIGGFSFGTISIVYSFCYLAGAILGPVPGMISAILADVLAFLVFPSGVYVPQLSLANGFMALFSGLACTYLKKIKHVELRLIPAAFLSYILLTMGLAAWGEAMLLFDMYPYTFAHTIGAAINTDNPYIMIALSKGITQSIYIVLNLIVSMIIVQRLGKIREQISFSLITFKEELSEAKKRNEIKK
jgi:uncharacterized membrane protein